MKKILQYLVTILVFLFIYHCDDNPAQTNDEKDTTEHQIDINQIFLFEVEYINFAWGYQHYGFNIDIKGNVHRYEIDSTLDFPLDTNEFSKIQLYEKFIQNAKYMYKIDKEIISDTKKLIFNAMGGGYSDTVEVGNDMGSTSYNCYYFDDKNEKYIRTILSVEGDRQYHNTTIEAKEIVDWLRTVIDI